LRCGRILSRSSGKEEARNMRLLHTTTLRLEEFHPGDIPAEYAILSHTWGKDEVTFIDLHTNQALSKPSFSKIQQFCKKASADGFDYGWIDTCCIDKSSSAELSEAINAMFRWYQEAKRCYAHLSDVPAGDISDAESDTLKSFRESRWFSRGWTLQELLAPKEMQFYSGDWRLIGDRSGLSDLICEISGIDAAYLISKALESASIAEKMSWQSTRETTRPEDIAYSLLGIFGVHMPLLYGEGGTNAFYRLQGELLRTFDDHSLFAWEGHGYDGRVTLNDQTNYDYWTPFIGALADSPADFRNCNDIVHANTGYHHQHFCMTNSGIQIKLPVCWIDGRSYGMLQCRRKQDIFNALGVPLTKEGRIWHRSGLKLRPIPQTFRVRIVTRERAMLLSPKPSFLRQSFSFGDFIIRNLPPSYFIASVYPWEAWIPGTRTIETGQFIETAAAQSLRMLECNSVRLVHLKSEYNQRSLLVVLQIIVGPYHKTSIRARLLPLLHDMSMKEVHDSIHDLTTFQLMKNDIYQDTAAIVLFRDSRFNQAVLFVDVLINEHYTLLWLYQKMCICYDSLENIVRIRSHASLLSYTKWLAVFLWCISLLISENPLYNWLVLISAGFWAVWEVNLFGTSMNRDDIRDLPDLHWLWVLLITFRILVYLPGHAVK
jgi:hypothetical protein